MRRGAHEAFGLLRALVQGWRSAGDTHLLADALRAWFDRWGRVLSDGEVERAAVYVQTSLARSGVMLALSEAERFGQDPASPEFARFHIAALTLDGDVSGEELTPWLHHHPALRVDVASFGTLATVSDARRLADRLAPVPAARVRALHVEVSAESPTFAACLHELLATGSAPTHLEIVGGRACDASVLRAWREAGGGAQLRQLTLDALVLTPGWIELLGAWSALRALHIKALHVSLALVPHLDVLGVAELQLGDILVFDTAGETQDETPRRARQVRTADLAGLPAPRQAPHRFQCDRLGEAWRLAFARAGWFRALRTLSVTSGSVSALDCFVAGMGEVSHLHTLSLHMPVRLERFEALLQHPATARLEVLRCTLCALDDAHVEAICAKPGLEHLHTLRLQENLISDEGARLLMAQPALSKLRVLHLDGNANISPAGCAALAGFAGWPALESLFLNGAADGSTHLAVARQPARAALRELLLRDRRQELPPPVDPDAMCALLRAPHLTRLHALFVDRARGREVVSAWHDAVFLSHLELLDLERVGLTDADLCALASNPDLHGVRELYLEGNAITDVSAHALAQSPHLSRLRDLRLQETSITRDGLRALLDSPHLPALTLLFAPEGVGDLSALERRARARGVSLI